MYSALAVANLFLELAEREPQDLTPMKLQKLVFLSHGWRLGLHKEPFVEEYAEAWEWGPVFSNLYHELKGFGRTPVKGRITNWGVLSQDEIFVLDAVVYEIPRKDEEATGWVETIWETYKEYTGIQLSKWLHMPDSPWHQVKNREGGVRRHEIIDDNIIQEYYENYGDE